MVQLEEGAIATMSAGSHTRATLTGMQAMHLVFPSTEIATRNALGELMQAIRPLGLGPDRAGSLEILLAEALNNIVEHAYPHGTRGVIELHCEPTDQALRFTILDRGTSLLKGIPEGLPANLDTELENLPEGGFGWFLIRELSETVTYLRSDNCNHLRLTFPLVAQTSLA